MAGFWHRLEVCIWPRFKAVIDAQVKTMSTTSGAALIDALPPPQEEGGEAVHSVTLRFAEQSTALWIAHASLPPQQGAMGRLTLTFMLIEFSRLIARAAGSLPKGKGDRFALAQYEHLLSAYCSEGVHEEDCERVRNLYESHCNAFAGQ
mmetsp:Transcript_22858/g.54647  ORF Transcript_22858/g.54647 Transcript_22858/m.54647 type:complete len:149 (-) Transcript_22858:124-570(-)